MQISLCWPMVPWSLSSCATSKMWTRWTRSSWVDKPRIQSWWSYLWGVSLYRWWSLVPLVYPYQLGIKNNKHHMAIWYHMSTYAEYVLNVIFSTDLPENIFSIVFEHVFSIYLPCFLSYDVSPVVFLIPYLPRLEKMGYNIGLRLIDEFLSKSGINACQDFRDTCEVIAKVGGWWMMRGRLGSGDALEYLV